MITVIVPSAGRAGRLESCLRALQLQTLDRAKYEILVVDSAPSPQNRQVLLQNLQTGTNLRFRIVRTSNPAAICNEGIRQASGAVIAFCGESATPSPDWLERIHGHFRAGFSGYIYGPVESEPDSGVFVDSHDQTDEFSSENFAIEKAVFDRVGMFDEGFRSVRPMASDFFFRLRDARVPFTFEPRLGVHRGAAYRSFRAFREHRRSAECLARLARKHPRHAPLRVHASMVLEAAATLAALLISAIAITYAMNTTPLLGIVLAPAPFAVRDLWRIIGIARRMAAHGMKLTFEDCRRYVLANWATAIAEAYYLLRGWVRFRFSGVEPVKAS